MNADRLLFWLPLLSCALLAVQGALGGVPWRHPAWRALLAAPLAAGAASLLAPRWAPWVTAGTFALAFLVPNTLQRLVNRAVRRQDYPRAAALARLTQAVAPHMRDRAAAQTRLLGALAQAARGQIAEADAALDALRRDPAAAAVHLSAAGQLCRLRGDWTLLPPRLGEGADADPVSVTLRLRALQETGNRGGALRLLVRHRCRLADHQALASLFVMAACGRTAAVGRLLAGPMRILAPPVRQYWRAAAALADGDSAGRAELERLAGGRDRLLALAARQRLDAAPPTPLTPDDQALLAPEEAAVPDVPLPWIGDAPVTLALVALNLLAYGAELLAGGAEQDAALFRLGGLWPGAVMEDGEWWRLGAALFLHAGPLHLAMNMLALLALGIRVERATGPLATLGVYAAAGLASTGGVLLLAARGTVPDDGLVGASGAIMGLLGALLVDGVRGWRLRRSVAALRGAAVLAAAVVLQTAFDLATPEVSLSAHLFGLAGGTLAALALRPGRSGLGQALPRARRWALGSLAAGAAALALAVWRGGA